MSSGPSISFDGRYVAFDSAAANLVPADGNGDFDAFVRDMVTGRTERVSVTSAGAEVHGDRDAFEDRLCLRVAVSKRAQQCFTGGAGG